MAEERIADLATEVRAFLLERQRLSVIIAEHYQASERLKYGKQRPGVSAGQKELIAQKIQELDASRQEAVKRRGGSGVPKEVFFITQIARGLVANKKEDLTLAKWPDYVEDQLHLLSSKMPVHGRPANQIIDLIARIIDALENQCLSKDERQLLIAITALALKD